MPSILQNPIKLDLLAPLLTIPDSRILTSFSIGNGDSMQSEEGAGRLLYLVGAPTFGSTNRGVGYVTLDGAADYVYADDDNWNRFSGSLTLLVTYRAAWASTKTIIGKQGAAGSLAFSLLMPSSTNQLRFTCSADGSTVHTTALSNGAGTTGSQWNTAIARFTPGAEVALWGNGLSAVNTTSVPATLHDSAEPLAIGARTEATPTQLLAGDFALAMLCGAALDDDHVTALLRHLKSFGLAQ